MALVDHSRCFRSFIGEAPYVNKEGKPCLDFQGIKEEAPVCRLVAVKL